jgi:hypothetical protein
MNCAKLSSSVGPSISDLDSLTELLGLIGWLCLEGHTTYSTPIDATLLYSWRRAIDMLGEGTPWYEDDELQVCAISIEHRDIVLELIFTRKSSFL